MAGLFVGRLAGDAGGEFEVERLGAAPGQDSEGGRDAAVGNSVSTGAGRLFRRGAERGSSVGNGARTGGSVGNGVRPGAGATVLAGASAVRVGDPTATSEMLRVGAYVGRRVSSKTSRVGAYVSKGWGFAEGDAVGD